MKRIPLVSAVLISLLWLNAPVIACFDTFCFLQRHGMTYPVHLLAMETSGEYVVQRLDQSAGDLFSGNLSFYYGITPRLTVQGSYSSSEKERTQFSMDEWGLRGVYGLIRLPGGYSLDAILEHRVATASSSRTLELSAPSIWNSEHVTAVVHPVLALSSESEAGLRGHSGLFYHLTPASIVGFGAEYESAQSSTNIGRRLVKGATGTSLFLGTQIGSRVFAQQELIKGWGADGSDVGFALTSKYLFPTR